MNKALKWLGEELGLDVALFNFGSNDDDNNMRLSGGIYSQFLGLGRNYVELLPDGTKFHVLKQLDTTVGALKPGTVVIFHRLDKDAPDDFDLVFETIGGEFKISLPTFLQVFRESR